MLGHPHVLQLLLTAGACTEHTTDDGLTALQLAAYHKHVDGLKLLVQAGADLEASADGKTALLA